MRKMILSVALLSFCVGSATAAEVYWDEQEFLDAIASAGGYLLEDFTGLPPGAIDNEPYPVGPMNGYAGDIYAEGLGGSYLWSCGECMSTENASDWLEIDFSPSDKDVYSCAGYVWASDINCGLIYQDVTVAVSDGTSETFMAQNTTTFIGFVSDTPLDWMTVDGVDSPNVAWPTLDHLYIDSPEPGSLCLLALGAIAALRRR